MQKSTHPANPKKTRSVLNHLLFIVPVMAVVSIISGVLYGGGGEVDSMAKIRLHDQTVEVEVADTLPDRAKGLSGRESLADGSGMLFVFEEPGLYDFHMEDMQFAIDIIWLDEDNRVVDVVHEVSPDTYPRTFGPRTQAKYVLEVPAGWSEDHGIALGDRAEVGGL